VPGSGGRTPPVVAVNLRAAVRTEIGGVERHARELAARLPALAPDRYRLLAPPVALAHRAGHLWEQAVLPVRARDAALILSPANLAPILSRRNVVVIHDAAALRHPEAYSAAFVGYQRRMLPALARRARLVLTVSAFARDELVALLGADPARIRITPGGVDVDRFADPGEPAASLRAALGLSRPYVLTVGTASARKNVTVLEPCARALRERGIELVVAGSERGYLRGAGTLTSALRRIGYVPEPLLPALYAHAEAFVLPSRHEGLGLPCLEAMAAGTPVLAARAGALPETVGDAGLLADPDTPADFTTALTAILDGPELRERLIAAGRTRAAGRTWARTAELTDLALEEALELPSG
jgi:glycosyltransferase involved in cell wall biosynthesis